MRLSPRLARVLGSDIFPLDIVPLLKPSRGRHDASASPPGPEDRAKRPAERPAQLDGEVFISIKCVPEPNFRQWLEAPRGWREVLAVYHAAGEGLAAAHRARISHRDFKPDNVIVGEDGRARVMDFGLARAEVHPRRRAPRRRRAGVPLD